MNRDLFREVPHWLDEAIQQKNPRVTLYLVDLILFVLDDLDIALVDLTNLN